MVRVCDGKTLPNADKNAVYLLRTFGSEAHEIWNVADPANPVLLTAARRAEGHAQELVGMRHRHRLPRLRRARLARPAHDADLRPLRDPAHPVKIRDFGLPGQEPGATGAVPTELHGPISTGPQGNRVYFGYGTNKGGVLQIVDREKLLKGPTGADAGEPARSRDRRGSMMSAWNGAHTTFPMLQMPIAEFAKDKDGAQARHRR